jgi:hypothetical protein
LGHFNRGQKEEGKPEEGNGRVASKRNNQERISYKLG